MPSADDKFATAHEGGQTRESSRSLLTMVPHAAAAADFLTRRPIPERTASTQVTGQHRASCRDRREPLGRDQSFGR